MAFNSRHAVFPYNFHTGIPTDPTPGRPHLFYLVPSRTITYYSGRTIRYPENKALQPTDLLFELANLDVKILAKLDTNIPHDFNGLETLTNPEIIETANSPERLSVQNVIDYLWNVVNDPDSS